MSRPDQSSTSATGGSNCRRAWRTLLMTSTVALSTAAMQLAGLGAASAASPDPVGHLLHQVHATAHKVLKPAGKAKQRPASHHASVPTRAKHRAAPHSAQAHSHPVTDYARSSVAHLKLAGVPLADLSRNTSRGTKDNTSADATLLAIGGVSVIGSQASSQGATTGHGPVPQIPLCNPTGGAVCLDALYADSAASRSGTSSQANTRTGVADLCLGGNDSTGKRCDGLHLGVAQGTSALNRGGSTGESSASSWTSLANLCLRHGTAGCLLGADLLGSHGSADTRSGATGESTIADLNLDGTSLGAPGEPVTLAIPTDCARPSLLCVFLNQGDQGVAGPLTTSAQSVVAVSGLGEQLGAVLGSTETGVTSKSGAGEAPSTSTNPATSGLQVAVGPSVRAAQAGALPHTGGVWSGLLAIGLLLSGLGALALGWSKRRVSL